MFNGTTAINLERSFDAQRLNEIVNHPDVRPDVANENDGVLDLTKIVEDDKNVLLVGEHGCVMFKYILPCLYETHTQILLSGRGEWALKFTKACGEYMFTKTDAFELSTRVPQPHFAAKALAIKAGFKFEFTRNDFCKFHGQDVPVDIYSARLQDWMPKAEGMEKVGEAFHTFLHDEAERLGIVAPPHDNDRNHNQYVGACMKMFLGGQLGKAVTFYNRWAILSRHAPISIISEDPPTIKFDIGLLKFENGHMEVVPC